MDKHTCFCGEPAITCVQLDAYDSAWFCLEHLLSFRYADGKRPPQYFDFCSESIAIPAVSEQTDD